MKINHDIVSLLFQKVHVRKFDSKVMARARVVCVWKGGGTRACVCARGKHDSIVVKQG